MAELITFDVVMDLEASDASNREKAEQLIAWADGPGDALSADISPASLLATASAYLGYAGDSEARWELLQRADTIGDQIDGVVIHAHLVAALLERGEPEQAKARAGDIRRSGRVRPSTSLFLAETFETHADLKAAERWFNIGLRVDEDGDSGDVALLLSGRWRVRRALGRPRDAYDDEAAALATTQGTEG